MGFRRSGTDKSWTQPPFARLDLNSNLLILDSKVRDRRNAPWKTHPVHDGRHSPRPIRGFTDRMRGLKFDYLNKGTTNWGKGGNTNRSFHACFHIIKLTAFIPQPVRSLI